MRRATNPADVQSYQYSISIHALREEGDDVFTVLSITDNRISIHALREEGDDLGTADGKTENIFLSTPSVRRATIAADEIRLTGRISIHALREEGDPRRIAPNRTRRYFYPRPP